MHFVPRNMYLAVVLLLLSKFASADYGCFSLVDTSASQGTEQYGTQISCSESCGPTYRYVAMKNGGDCYCLKSLPSSLLSTGQSQCSVPCNGYGSEICGGRNAFTVFDNIKYLGPAGGGTTSLTSQKSLSSTSTLSPNTPTRTSTNTGTSTTQGSQTPENSPGVTSIVTSMTSGSVEYKTVTTTSSSSSGPSPTASSGSTPSDEKKKSSLNIAPIVGGVVGGVAALALALAVVFFILRRKSREDDDEEDFYKKGSSGSTVSGGVLRARSNKINSVFDMPMANPFEHPSDDLAEKRASKAANGLVDPRLNPVMMGRRRLSEGSLADETDYSRKILGVANP